MKAEDIDNIQAGREMDWDIAVNIFGLNIFREKTDDKLYVHASRFRHEWQELPRYSTDIAAAWLVVEKLAALGFPVHIQAGQHRYGVVGYRDILKDEWMWADTAPLAICRAALKAVAHEDK